jgi:hypothetical protein
MRMARTRDLVPPGLAQAVLEGNDTSNEAMGIAYFLYPNAILIVSEIHQEMFRIYPGETPGSSYLCQTYALYNDSAFADDGEFSAMMYEAIRVALAEEDAPMGRRYSGNSWSNSSSMAATSSSFSTNTMAGTPS